MDALGVRMDSAFRPADVRVAADYGTGVAAGSKGRRKATAADAAVEATTFQTLKSAQAEERLTGRYEYQRMKAAASVLRISKQAICGAIWPML